MKIIANVLNMCLCLFTAFSLIQCTTSSECQSKKIQLLLEDIFKKKNYYYVIGSVQSIDSSNKTVEPIDSSMYFIYLCSPNLKIPNKEFYLHLDKHLEPSYPDSVKLKEVNDLSKTYKYNYKVGIDLLEVNDDTTKLKISVSWLRKVFLAEIIYTYSFDEKNCKWTVSDLTKKVY